MEDPSDPVEKAVRRLRPPFGFPFGDRNLVDGSVRYWEHKTQTDTVIARSVREFLSKLVNLDHRLWVKTDNPLIEQKHFRLAPKIRHVRDDVEESHLIAEPPAGMFPGAAIGTQDAVSTHATLQLWPLLLGVVMPITPHLKGMRFDPELTMTMGAAFERVCNALDCEKDSALRVQIAQTVIALAQHGIKNADQLVAATLAEISGPKHALE